MKFSVDKIEGNIVVMQNLNDMDIRYVDISLLPKEVCETDIIMYDGNNYVIDYEEKQKRKNIVLDKMKRLMISEGDE